MVECYSQVIPKYSEKTLTCPTATSSASKPTALRAMLKTTEGVRGITAVHFK